MLLLLLDQYFRTCFFVFLFNLTIIVASINLSYFLDALIKLVAFIEECFGLIRILFGYLSVPINQVLNALVNILHYYRIRINLRGFTFNFSSVTKDTLRVSFNNWFFLINGLTVVLRVIGYDFSFGSVTSCIWKRRGLVLSSSRADWTYLKSSVLPLSLQHETALEVFVLKSAAARRVRYSIELDWLAACWTLNFFCEPSTEAY